MTSEEQKDKLMRQPKPDVEICKMCLGYGGVASGLYTDPNVKLTCNGCHGWGWIRVKPE